ncbi:MAG: hypothetical protein ACTSXH_05760 [Promethearchaeota archaeon]
MLFHQKINTDNEKDPYEEYQVLCGIEEEFLIIDEDGILKEAADEIMMKAAELLDKNRDLLKSLRFKIRSLDAEPSPSQIEYVTLPLEPRFIKDAVKAGRQLLIKAAREIDAKIVAQSLHPIQSDPHPIVGTHINVSVQKKGHIMKAEELEAVHNYLWNYLPEIIGITANSPIYKGNITNIASNRCANSTVLKQNGFAKIQVPENRPALVPMRYYGRMRYQLKIGSGEDEFSKKVITNSRGDRLVDITPRGPFTNISNDKDETPSRNRVEVRVIDVQQDIQDLLDMTYLCCISGLHAVYLNSIGTITRDPFHDVNLNNAIAHGHKLKLKRPNGIEESLEDSLIRWLEETFKYQSYLGIEIKNLPSIKLKKAPPQKDLSVKYRTRKIEKFRQQGKTQALVELVEPRTVQDQRGNQYKVRRNTRIEGILMVRYELKYKEDQEGLVTTFTNISIVNYLNVQGIYIPLNKNDRILKVYTETESLLDRLFGNFGF